MYVVSLPPYIWAVFIECFDMTVEASKIVVIAVFSKDQAV